MQGSGLIPTYLMGNGQEKRRGVRAIPMRRGEENNCISCTGSLLRKRDVSLDAQGYTQNKSEGKDRAIRGSTVVEQIKRVAG